MSHKVVLVVKKPKVQRGVSNRAVAIVSAVLVLVLGVAVLLNGDERSGLLEDTFNDKVQMVSEIHRAKTCFYYESIKREFKISPIYECRCDERLQTNTKEVTHLVYTGLVVELEHLKIKTRLTNEKLTRVKGECEI